MPHRLLNMFSRGGAPAVRANSNPTVAVLPTAKPGDRKATYAKVFRWSPSHGHDHQPDQVEIVGSFTNWQPRPMTRHAQDHSWQVTVDGIEANKTHHYMLLVNGHPANDKMSDGYAVPQGEAEKRYALTTPRGPRLFMLFAQAK